MNETKLIVIRHGETVSNTEKRLQGHSDSPLSVTGISQSKAVAKRLKNVKFSELYCSDLGRAIQTAELISQQTGHKLIKDQRLRERNLGIFQGLVKDEIKIKYPEHWKSFHTAGPDYIIPDGESANQRFQRSINCFEEIAQNNFNKSVVIISHGSVLDGLFRYVVGVPIDLPRKMKIWNAGYNEFIFQDGIWLLNTWGDISHLTNIRALDLW